MSEKTEALRLAEFLEMHWCNVDMPEAKAAAELRRLHSDNERIGPLAERVLELKAQRDALLEALAVVLLEAEHTLLEPTRRKARAAIAAVEEGK